MNLYETIKAAVTTRQAAESFGLTVDKHGMALCPFHDDHHPSLKLDKRYYCFACGESGDVIDFTAKFFGISVHSAAIKLARDFGIDPRPPTRLNIPIPDAEPFQEEELPCIFSLAQNLQRYASNPDIKTELSKHNFHPVIPEGKYRDISNRIIREAGCRVRKDSVTAVEALITASPEFFEKKSRKEIREFFSYAVEFMKFKQDPNTYISAVVHVDEKTPHMHLCFVPITPDGRLSAKEIIGNKKRLTKWQDEFWSYMVKKYPDFERGESASQTGRIHIPPRLFKQAARLNRQKDKLLQLLSEMNAINAKAKSKEIAALLEDYIPGVEELMTKLKKTSLAAKEMRGEIADLKKAVNSNKSSALRQLELEKKVQELDDLQYMVESLQKTVDAIPDETLAIYNEPKSDRKEIIAIE